jgi:bacillithiol system protein YtxJ
MGVFGSLFGNNGDKDKKEEKSIPWIPLSSLDQLEEIEKKSSGKPQIIFKHSTTCGISRMVMNMFNSSYDLSENQADLYYLDLHNYREISNEVGYRFQVVHQSPQLLVIRNGNTVSHASHSAIAEIELKQYV